MAAARNNWDAKYTPGDVRVQKNPMIKNGKIFSKSFLCALYNRNEEEEEKYENGS